MSKLAYATGASGFATITLLGVSGMSIRIMGAMGVSGSVAGTNLAPQISFTNVRDDAAGTFTAIVGPEEGGGGGQLSRAVPFLPRPEQHFDVAQGQSSVCVYQSGVSTSTPQLQVWYDKW